MIQAAFFGYAHLIERTLKTRKKYPENLNLQLDARRAVVFKSSYQLSENPQDTTPVCSHILGHK